MHFQTRVVRWKAPFNDYMGPSDACAFNSGSLIDSVTLYIERRFPPYDSSTTPVSTFSFFTFQLSLNMKNRHKLISRGMGVFPISQHVCSTISDSAQRVCDCHRGEEKRESFTQWVNTIVPLLLRRDVSNPALPSSLKWPHCIGPRLGRRVLFLNVEFSMHSAFHQR